LKKTEAGLKGVKLWGKFITLNGKDYLLAKGVKDAPYVFGGKVVADQKYYYSQNGVTWLDLAPLNDETYTRASTISGMLSGQPGKKYRVEEPAPVAEGEAPTPEAEGEEGEEPTGPEPLKFVITETQRLRFMMQSISAGTDVVPDGYFTTTAKNDVCPNPLFAGLSYPDKLDSYSHGPMGTPLVKDVSGSWAMQYDSFKGLATLRSLAYPGFTFVYSTELKEYDSLYLGTGEANKDMMFMIA
jgi:radial spoke head protein 9